MQTIRLSLLGLVATSLLGCSGGGSEGSTAALSTTTTPDAVVGVILTDATSDEVEQVIATFTRIELVGPDGSFVMFEGEETVDLLDLADAYELFTVTSAPPDTFDLVRFEINSVRIVSEAEDGSLVTAPVALSSSTIDVAFAGGFTVAEGQVLFLEADFDVEKALELMAEDDSGELTLTPLIFIEIHDELPAHKFARVHGAVDEVTEAGLRVCDTQLVSSIDSIPRSLDVCVDVAFDELTTAFGEDGLPIIPPVLMVGDPVTVVGRLDRRITSIPPIPRGHLPPPDECRLWHLDRTTGDQPPPQRCEEFLVVPDNAVLIDHDGFPIGDIFGINAYVVERGELETFSRFEGKATTTVLADQFDFLVEPNQGIVTDLPILTTLFPQTRIFSSDGTEVTPFAIQPESKAVVDGILALSDIDADEVRAAFIMLSNDEQLLTLSGRILSVQETSLSMTIATDTGDRCVDTENADVFVLSLEDGRLVSTKLEFAADLLIDQHVDVFGEEGIDGCFVAETVLAGGS